MSNIDTKKLKFTKEQVLALRKVFPQRVLSPSATEQELRDYFGEQKVMNYIEARAV